MKQIGAIPTRTMAFGFDANVERSIAFEQIEGKTTNEREVTWGMVFADAVLIFSKSNVQYLVESVLNLPMGANDLKQPIGVRRKTGDEVASVGFRFACQAAFRGHFDQRA